MMYSLKKSTTEKRADDKTLERNAAETFISKLLKIISIFNSSNAKIGIWISALYELVLQAILYSSRLTQRL
mgnify:CR=1 FL=1